jgi:hypothetical protein
MVSYRLEGWCMCVRMFIPKLVQVLKSSRQGIFKAVAK